MPTPIIALSARAAGRARPKSSAPWRAQRGVTLIELMVGITIGLLVVAVALAALMVSRGISGTVSDASDIQQQSAYALRLLGSQLRQTGSLRLGTSTTPLDTDPMVKLAFSIKDGTDAGDPYYLDATTATGQAALLNGTEGGGTSPDTLTVGFARDQVSVFTSANPVTMAVNCIGGPADIAANAARAVVQSAFSVDSDAELQCSGNVAAPQPVIQNVANFQVRYLVQNTAGLGSPQIQYANATEVPSVSSRGWAAVRGVEVCLVLYGKEIIDMPANSHYTDCDGATVYMTDSSLPAARRGRMHMVFRNVFQLRSMGVM